MSFRHRRRSTNFWNSNSKFKKEIVNKSNKFVIQRIPSGTMESVKKWLSLLYLRYEMITCISMFEPWEKILISKLLFVFVFM